MAAFLICKPGGLIGRDDYRLPNLEKGSHPGDAIDGFLAIYHQHVDVVHNGYQLWFRRIDLAEPTGEQRSRRKSAPTGAIPRRVILPPVTRPLPLARLSPMSPHSSQLPNLER